MADEPLQIGELLVIAAFGAGLIVTSLFAVDVQPVWLETVTE
jgi:hypothetical protein